MSLFNEVAYAKFIRIGVVRYFLLPLTRREVEILTEAEALERAKARIRAEHAAYMREWRKKNPDKVKASSERSKLNKLKKYVEEGKQNE